MGHCKVLNDDHHSSFIVVHSRTPHKYITPPPTHLADTQDNCDMTTTTWHNDYNLKTMTQHNNNPTTTWNNNMTRTHDNEQTRTRANEATTHDNKHMRTHTNKATMIRNKNHT